MNSKPTPHTNQQNKNAKTFFRKFKEAPLISGV